MYATGKIGLWSIIEEGTGIFAGSLPALRPLLSLPFLNRGRSTTPAFGSKRPNDKSSKFSEPRNEGYETSDVDLDKFQRMEDSDQVRDEDADSQKHILRQIRVNITNEKDANDQAREWKKSQVLGWRNSGYRGRSETASIPRDATVAHGHENMV